MAIFTEVTENERIIDRHLRDIHPLLYYDASERHSMISIWLKYAYQHYYDVSVRRWFQYYAAVARFLCDS